MRAAVEDEWSFFRKLLEFCIVILTLGFIFRQPSLLLIGEPIPQQQLGLLPSTPGGGGAIVTPAGGPGTAAGGGGSGPALSLTGLPPRGTTSNGPSAAAPTTPPPATAKPRVGVMSPDRRHWWDGSQWVDVTVRIPSGARRSPDGGYWWDGTDWRPSPTGGQRV